MRAAFRHPGFGWLFAGTTASMFGDSVMLLVFSMWVKDLTGSNGLAGLTFFFMLLPSLIAPVLGGAIDRVRRKRLLVWGNLASAAMLVPLFAVRDASEVWIIWVVAFLYGISFVVLPAGLNGLLKELLPDDELIDANASLQTVKESFRLFGPLLGAGLFALTHGWGVVAVDLVSFLIAAMFIARIKLAEDRPEHESSHLRADLLVGWRHLMAEPVLKHVVFAFGIVLLVLGFSEASVYAITDAFGLPTEAVGVGVSIQGIGAVLGGLSASRMAKRIGEMRTIMWGLVAMACSFAWVALAPTLWLMIPGIVLCGWSLPISFIAYTTLIQKRTPQRIMGRVSTAIEVLLGTPQALSLALGAVLVSVVSYQVIWLTIASVTAIAATYLWTQSRMVLPTELGAEA